MTQLLPMILNQSMLAVDPNISSDFPLLVSGLDIYKYSPKIHVWYIYP